jgi:hypothetical protein
MRVNAAMRLLAEPVEPAERRVVPPELEDVLAEGGGSGRAGTCHLAHGRSPRDDCGRCLRRNSVHVSRQD